VLSSVRQNPDWGCLIKSKVSAYDELPEQSGLQDVVANLERDGRCLRLPLTVNPTLAAMAGDVVACFGVNSAGVQAAVGSGRPTLHFDPNHLTMHPLFVAGGEGKIIFRDAESFTTALRAIAAGDRKYGDHTPWCHLFDPFGDGMGRARSGEVMRNYIAARDRGLALDDALREAVSTYAACHGIELATTRLQPNASSGDVLWQTVRHAHYPDWPEDFPFTSTTLSMKGLDVDDHAMSAVTRVGRSAR
jgi:hypothetical protein